MSKLGTKSWHLNDAIKKMLRKKINTLYYMDAVVHTMMHTPNTDTVIGDMFVYQSGKGVVSGGKLNLDDDAQ